jgi:hypothetical protein
VRNVSAILSISIDRVIQALGRPDEDTRGGFDRWRMRSAIQRRGHGSADG